MSVTFDQTDRTFDQTCWTWDGFDGCVVRGGGMELPRPFELQIHNDDRDILDIITAFINCKYFNR